MITVSEGKKLQNELELVDRMKFDRGFIPLYFISNAKTEEVELENPLILLVEKKVTNIQQILPLLELSLRKLV